MILFVCTLLLEFEHLFVHSIRLAVGQKLCVSRQIKSRIVQLQVWRIRRKRVTFTRFHWFIESYPPFYLCMPYKFTVYYKSLICFFFINSCVQSINKFTYSITIISEQHSCVFCEIISHDWVGPTSEILKVLRKVPVIHSNLP